MGNSRTDERIKAVKVLYNYDLLKDLNQALDSVNTEEPIGEFGLSLIDGVNKSVEQIDELINKSLVDYSINRLSFVDRAIIRVATYEMINGLEKAIVINEAIKITNIYTNLDDNKAKAFNNRLLENIYNNIK